MRKYLIGAVIGAALATGTTAFADDVASMIGKTVEGVFPVKVNGQKVEKDAIVIDGTSYLPVRALGDALGMNVGFDADLGITLDKKSETMAASTTQISATGGGTVITKSPNTDTSLFKNVKITYGETFEFNTQVKDFGLFEDNGEQYVTIIALVNRPFEIDFKNPNAMFMRDGENILTVDVVGQYSSGCSGFDSRYGSFVKLSLLGLKATANGDTLVIEKQS